MSYRDLLLKIDSYNQVKMLQKESGKLSLQKRCFHALRFVVNKLKGVEDENRKSEALSHILKMYKKYIVSRDKCKVTNYMLNKYGEKALKDYHNGGRVDETIILENEGYRLIFLFEYKYHKGDYKQNESKVKENTLSRFDKKICELESEGWLTNKTTVFKILLINDLNCFSDKAIKLLRKNVNIIETHTGVNLNTLFFDKPKYIKTVEALSPIGNLIKDFVLSPSIFYSTYHDNPFIPHYSPTKILSMYTEDNTNIDDSVTNVSSEWNDIIRGIGVISNGFSARNSECIDIIPAFTVGEYVSGKLDRYIEKDSRWLSVPSLNIKKENYRRELPDRTPTWVQILSYN